MGNVLTSLLKRALHSRIEPLRKFANKTILNRLAYAVEPRPRPLSMAADYSTWRGLTDRIYSGRQLPPDHAFNKTVPPINEVLSLFERKEEKLDDRTTLLFPFFAQWFTDSFLRTKWKPIGEQDFKENESNHEIDLNQIYGMTEVQTDMLRSKKGGRLKSQFIEGEEYPVFLFDQKTAQLKPEFKGLYTDSNFERVFGNAPKEHKLHAFAVGLEHGNSTIGNTLMNTLFLREHNRVARVISDAHPNWNDERVFQTTRNVMIVVLIKIVLADYIYHISGAAVFADPGGFAEDEKWYRTNWMSVEFALLYRWHDLIPNSVTFDGETKDGTQLRQNNRWLLKAGVDRVIQDASSQRAGTMGLGNTPDFLLPVRQMSLHMSRTCNLPSYVNYCKEYGLDVPKTFQDLTGDKAVAAKLENVYGSIDKVEWFVGLFAQERVLFSGRMMTVMVGNDAVTQAFTNPLLAKRVYNEDTFSAEGLKIAEETSRLHDVVLRNTSIKDPTTVAFGFDRRD